MSSLVRSEGELSLVPGGGDAPVERSTSLAETAGFPPTVDRAVDSGVEAAFAAIFFRAVLFAGVGDKGNLFPPVFDESSEECALGGD